MAPLSRQAVCLGTSGLRQATLPQAHSSGCLATERSCLQTRYQSQQNTHILEFEREPLQQGARKVLEELVRTDGCAQLSCMHAYACCRYAHDHTTCVQGLQAAGQTAGGQASGADVHTSALPRLARLQGAGELGTYLVLWPSMTPLNLKRRSQVVLDLAPVGSVLGLYYAYPLCPCTVGHRQRSSLPASWQFAEVVPAALWTSKQIPPLQLMPKPDGGFQRSTATGLHGRAACQGKWLSTA